MTHESKADDTVFQRRTFLTASLGTSVPLVTGCIGGGESTPEYDREPQDEIRVTEEGFDPVQAWVPPGVEVTWVNDTGGPHTLASNRFHDDTKQWGFSYTMGGNDEATHTFEEGGVYQYECNIHGPSSECGVVVVGDASFDRTLPCE